VGGGLSGTGVSALHAIVRPEGTAPDGGGRSSHPAAADWTSRHGLERAGCRGEGPPPVALTVQRGAPPQSCTSGGSAFGRWVRFWSRCPRCPGCGSRAQLRRARRTALGCWSSWLITCAPVPSRALELLVPLGIASSPPSDRPSSLTPTWRHDHRCPDHRPRLWLLLAATDTSTTRRPLGGWRPVRFGARPHRVDDAVCRHRCPVVPGPCAAAAAGAAAAALPGAAGHAGEGRGNAGAAPVVRGAGEGDAGRKCRACDSRCGGGGSSGGGGQYEPAAFIPAAGAASATTTTTAAAAAAILQAPRLVGG